MDESSYKEPLQEASFSWANAVSFCLSVAAFVISVFAFNVMKHQNLIGMRQALFSHALEMQSQWIEHTDLYPYFYKNKVLDGSGVEEIQVRTKIICEMLADMLDHAAASDLQQMTEEGWGAYAQDMYDNSPAFREFLASTADWYPSVGKWVPLNGKPRSQEK